MTEPLLFELDKKGRRGYALPKLDVPTVDPADHIPTKFLRKQLNMPSLSELETVRHFTRLSRMNHSVDVGFYPLGSCTMDVIILKLLLPLPWNVFTTLKFLS
jgi:glycine dehydrogenase subunit 2